MPENRVLSKNVKKIRKEMEKSQIEFAADCGISTEILSLIEREKANPKLNTLQMIASYTGYTVAELLDVKKEE